MDGKRNDRYDILPPPLEKITREKKTLSKGEQGGKSYVPSGYCRMEKSSSIREDLTTSIEASAVPMATVSHSACGATVGTGENPNISEKYANVILNCEEINTIMSKNPRFNYLVGTPKVTEFMNAYLTNPLEAISKYQKDKEISSFLDMLFQYMTAKSNHTHLDNLQATFTFRRG
ncbi:conserved Plasmodium protein, unknown function [Plasmodium ovale]|uniref:Uncharacterized protein n=2 Tax=Plasmodium ovale TaxID=36330 RepID=A0A1A8VRT5_PLAOA|nr:conserved Plasmodium protein, unknown function [Plasmodium ovale curtisi]SBS86920.1 conserved Plasmodium protein, unknown function [Plasmodium ovale curtisi]SCQ16318.1 conserved Plasmodium protein, unknown function [Plasmodium ovale]